MTKAAFLELVKQKVRKIHINKKQSNGHIG